MEISPEFENRSRRWWDSGSGGICGNFTQPKKGCQPRVKNVEIPPESTAAAPAVPNLRDSARSIRTDLIQSSRRRIGLNF